MKNLSAKSDVVDLKLLDQPSSQVLLLLGNWPLRKRICMLPSQLEVGISDPCNSVLSEFFIQHY